MIAAGVDVVGCIDRRIGGLETGAVNYAMNLRIDRRIGGLEKSVL